MTAPVAFVVPADALSRTPEVPLANFDNGGNWAGSNAPGIGVAPDYGSLEPERPESWTLLDQDGDARTPQVSQNIGGVGFVDRATVDWSSSGGVGGKGTTTIYGVVNPDNVDGAPEPGAAPTENGDATLADIAAGWTLVVA